MLFLITKNLIELNKFGLSWLELRDLDLFKYYTGEITFREMAKRNIDPIKHRFENEIIVKVDRIGTGDRVVFIVNKGNTHFEWIVPNEVPADVETLSPILRRLT